MSNIPKIIHYCWFGTNPLPPSAINCIDSWKKFLPDYEIKEWNEENFDVEIIPYTAEAYRAKKYAFVSDYARFWILYKYGGIYFDTDVEVIRNLDDIIAHGNFMGCENQYQFNVTPAQLAIAPGLGLGVNPGLGLIKELLDTYSDRHFIKSDGSYDTKTIVATTTEVLCKHGLKMTPDIQICSNVWIYPSDYFCPKDKKTLRVHLTPNSRTIHHFDATWIPANIKLKNRFIHMIGPKATKIGVLCKKILRGMGFIH